MSATAAGQMKLIRALVDHEDADDLRAVLAEAGAVSIVLSEASLYTEPARTDVRGQRRTVEFDRRLRLEVIAEEHRVPRIVQATQGSPVQAPTFKSSMPRSPRASAQTPPTDLLAGVLPSPCSSAAIVTHLAEFIDASDFDRRRNERCGSS